MPEITGSRVRISRVVGSIAREHETTFAYLGDPGEHAWSTGSTLDGASVHRLPADVVPAAQELRSVISEFRPDVVWASGTWIDPMLPEELEPALVVDLQHSERAVMTRAAAECLRSISKPASRRRLGRLVLDARRRLRAERRTVGRADLVTGCSRADLDSVCSRLDVETLLVPNGIDPPPSTYRRQPAAPPRVLFVGNLYYAPNLAAATQLLDVVLPAIRSAMPDVRVDVVGNVPPHVRETLERPHADVHGVVDDLLPLYRRAAVTVLPIVSGSGTRTKVLEACAHGVPVVTTPMGAEGLDLSDREISIASVGELATATLELLNDAELARRRAVAAQRRVERTASWAMTTAPIVDRLRTPLGHAAA